MEANNMSLNPVGIYGFDPQDQEKRRVYVDENGQLYIRGNFTSLTKHVLWDTSTDFNKGTHSQTEVYGTGSSAIVRLQDKGNSLDNIGFTNPLDYTYDPAKVIIGGGLAKLKASGGSTTNWDFSVPADYTYDPAKIEVVGGVAKLKGTPLASYAHWLMNETTGTTVADSSGNGRNGTTVNMDDSNHVAGKLNNALYFDGNDEYVNCGDIANFERTQAMTIEFWIKRTTDAGIVISRAGGTAPYRGWWVNVNMSFSRLDFVLCNTWSTNVLAVHTPLTPIPLGVWTHVIITYDGSSSPSGVLFYINGVLRGTNTLYNTLSATILNTSTCVMGNRYGDALYLNTTLDEMVIYTRVLTSDEIQYRYNSGAGTEILPTSYPIDNPTIVNNTGAAYTVSLSQFVETATKPSGTGIKYHVSANNGASWLYWNGAGWVGTDGSYIQANLASDINVHIGALGTPGTFKFRALLHADTAFIGTPELSNIFLEEGAEYPLGDNVITMNNNIQPAQVCQWITATETVTKPALTDVQYQYSIDNGLTYNGTWLTAAQLQTALLLISCIKDGTDKLKIKFNLTTTNIYVTPEIDNLAIGYWIGYYESGTYTSNIFDSGFYSQAWSTSNWLQTTPAGCTAALYARASNDSSSMGAWTGPLTNGSVLGLTGKYLQWKVDFTGNKSSTPNLGYFGNVFVTQYYEEVSP
jgi:hypothetical protein